MVKTPILRWDIVVKGTLDFGVAGDNDMMQKGIAF